MVRAFFMAGLLALAGSAAAAPPGSTPVAVQRPSSHPRMVVVAYDRETGRAAALWIGDRQDADDLHASGSRIALVMTTDAPGLAPSELLGHATGRDGPRERLAAWIRQRNEPRDVIAGWADAQGVSSFEGRACMTCRAAIRGDVLVMGIDVSQDTVAEAAQRVVAVDGDVVDRLLAFATRGPFRWPHRGRPPVELVAQYDDDVVESIRSDGGRAASRVLMRDHLRSLAEVVAPHFLSKARVACADVPDSATCVAMARRARRSASRALEVFHRDEELRDVVSEATRFLDRADAI